MPYHNNGVDKLFIGGLPRSATSKDLDDYFEQYVFLRFASHYPTRFQGLGGEFSGSSRFASRSSGIRTDFVSISEAYGVAPKKFRDASQGQSPCPL